MPKATTDSQLARRPHPRVLIGDVDVSEYVLDVKTHRAVSTIPTAEVELSIAAADRLELDYLADSSVGFVWNDQYHPQLTGVISTVNQSTDRLHIQFVGAPELVDNLVPGFEYQQVLTAELVFTIARSAGVSEDRTDVDGLDTITAEEIQVAVPIRGLRTSHRVAIGGCTLAPRKDVDWATRIYPEGDLSKAFIAHDAFALTQVSARFMYDAERVGLNQAEVLVAWAATRLRYGAARLPGGEIQAFDRNASRTVPRLGEVVAVKGMESGRQWLRIPNFARKQSVAELSEHSLRGVHVPDDRMNLQEREALLAFWRAVESTDPLSSVIAIWDAIEFYVGGTQAEKLFKPEDLDRLRSEAPDWLNPTQSERLQQMVDSLNNAP